MPCGLSYEVEDSQWRCCSEIRGTRARRGLGDLDIPKEGQTLRGGVEAKAVFVYMFLQKLHFYCPSRQ